MLDYFFDSDAVERERRKKSREMAEYAANVDAILYRSKSSMSTIQGNLRNSQSSLWLSYLGSVSFSLLVLASLFLMNSSYVSFDGKASFGVVAQVLWLAILSFFAGCYINGLQKKRKAAFKVTGHQMVIAQMARHLSLDYTICSLAECAVKISWLLGFVGTSTYVVFKGDQLGLLVVRTKSLSSEANVTFTPMNDALYIIIGDMKRPYFLRRCVGLHQVFAVLEHGMYPCIDFEVPYKRLLLMAAIPRNKYVAELTRIEDSDCIAAWLRLHLPDSVVARRLEDVDICALVSLYTEHDKAYIPTPFFIEIVRAYVNNPGREYAQVCAHWLNVFVTSRRPSSPQYSWPDKHLSPNSLLSLLMHDDEPQLEGYEGQKLVPDFISASIKMLVERLGVDSCGILSDSGVLGYRYLYGTEQALKKYPAGKGLFLRNDMSL